MPGDRIVEVLSAANIVEAHSVRARLEEAGIVAQIVGESLVNAVGWLPAAETTPRVWVRQADEARARELIAEYLSEAHQEAAEPEDAGSPEEAEGPIDAQEPVQAGEPAQEGDRGPGGAERPAARANWVALVGVACVAAGVLHAAYRWIAVGKYSARTEGVLVRSEWADLKIEPRPGSRDLPIWPQKDEVRALYDLSFAYVVGDREYRAEVKKRDRVVEHVTIHYDPANPADCLVGPLVPPWLSLVFGGLFGAGLLFVAYRFR